MDEPKTPVDPTVNYGGKVYGDVEIVGPNKNVILTSANGTRWRLGVSNAGAAVFTAI